MLLVYNRIDPESDLSCHCCSWNFHCLGVMLGLLNSSPAGVYTRRWANGPIRTPKTDAQPCVHENMAADGSSNRLDSDIIARAAAANAAAMGRNMSNYQATLASPLPKSPSPAKSSWASAETNGLRIRKESSYYGSSTINGRRKTSTFRNNSNFESGCYSRVVSLSERPMPARAWRWRRVSRPEYFLCGPTTLD